MSIWAKWIEADGRFLFSLDNNGGHEISRERHLELLEACAGGQLIRPQHDGLPEIHEQPLLSIEILSERERIWRTGELARYEWLVSRHREEQDMGITPTLTATQVVELLGYRQTLRDWPSASVFPNIDQRPVSPVWLLETDE